MTSGLVLIDKPQGWTSHDVVAKVRKAVGTKKVGHAGTLDPLATGLLIVCSGKKTKTINELMGLEKEYTGTFYIGATTPCFDLEKPIDNTFPINHITNEILLLTAKSFLGFQQQVPPIYSAVKINGKRAYEFAREASKKRDLHFL